jgi:hypothetical protein
LAHRVKIRSAMTWEPIGGGRPASALREKRKQPAD